MDGYIAEIRLFAGNFAPRNWAFCNTSFQSNGIKEISLPKLATGVYVVQLQSDLGKLNKKIILE